MTDTQKLVKAILWKYPGANVTFVNGALKSWTVPGVAKPSDRDLTLLLGEYEVAAQKELYKDLRRKEYPPIEDQLDAIWKGGADMEAMRCIVLAVKAKYPKPEKGV